MKFSKWHALGNAYLLVEQAEAGGPLDGDRVRALCDPDTGVGADGVVEIVAVESAAAQASIWNADGSRAELSGNGARIAASWVAGRSGSREITVYVGDRIVLAHVLGDGSLVETQVGAVEVGAAEILVADGELVEFVPVSVGNPHAVIQREPDRETLLRLGPLLESHERFPNRTNVQLVSADGPNDLTVAVWERGVGETRSSGTSAVAATAAAVTNGWCQSPATVHLPGGDLYVAVTPDGQATLTGPAEEIFHGEMSG
jgi:diaminopimelate epimerase